MDRDTSEHTFILDGWLRATGIHRRDCPACMAERGPLRAPVFRRDDREREQRWNEDMQEWEYTGRYWDYHLAEWTVAP